MPIGKFHFTLDLPGLIVASRIPLIAAIVLGLTDLIDISLGGLWGVIFTAFWAWVGYWYMNKKLATVAPQTALNTVANAAVLTAVMALAYELTSWLALSIRYHGSTLQVLSILFYMIQTGFIGALGAIAWYAYKNGLLPPT